MGLAQVRKIEENALAYYDGMARLLGGEYVEQDRITWFVTGRRSLPRFNGVLRTVVRRPEDLPGVVEPILEIFLSRSLPFFWVDWPILGTPGLGDYLGSRGLPLTPLSLPAMARGLDDLPQVPLPKEVEIVRVQRPQDQVEWLDVLMEGYGEPGPARPDYREYLANSLAEAEPVFEHFLARWRGEPCAVSTLLRAGHSAGIYHVATLPAYRGRGLGKALTLAAMHSARSAGYSEAILFATPPGYPLYQRLGFETVCPAGLFVWQEASGL